MKFSSNGSSVWDSGKVASNNTLNIPYGGPALKDDSDYSWEVVWWDANGNKAQPATRWGSKIASEKLLVFLKFEKSFYVF